MERGAKTKGVGGNASQLQCNNASSLVPPVDCLVPWQSLAHLSVVSTPSYPCALDEIVFPPPVLP